MQRMEHIELAMEELERYGLKGEVSERGKHLEIGWETPLGRRFVIVPKTPSDWRGCLNSRSDVRKLLRADNLQPKAINELTFQKAMSLPKAPVLPREQLLKNDIDALTDMVFELQSSLAVLQQQNDMLQERMNSATVVSKITSSISFSREPQPAPLGIVDNGDEIIEVVEKTWNIPSHKSGPFRKGSAMGDVIAALTDVFQSKHDIAKRLQLPLFTVNQALFKGKRAGFVEHGLRNMYRRKQP